MSINKNGSENITFWINAEIFHLPHTVYLIQRDSDKNSLFISMFFVVPSTLVLSHNIVWWSTDKKALRV